MKTCKSCGNELKENKNEKLCHACICAKKVMEKGIEHTRSSEAVKGLKMISLFGRGWAEKLVVRKTKKNKNEQIT
jgi:hypothetical protein